MRPVRTLSLLVHGAELGERRLHAGALALHLARRRSAECPLVAFLSVLVAATTPLQEVSLSVGLVENP